MATARTEQKARTRRELLRVARRHFERDGFEAASLRAIAREAGVAAGTVVLHFDGKRELLHAALFEDLEATIDRALRPVPGATLEEELHAIAATLLGYYRKRPTLSRTLLKESMFADPPWAERFAAQVARVHARVAELYVHAAVRGEVVAEGDATTFGLAWVAFYYFALIAWAQGAHPSPVALLDAMIAQHLAGSRPARARKRKGRRR